jgi:membrane protease YdiL (CAAX protease family)
MAFDLKNISHLFAAFMLIVTFIVILGLPLITLVFPLTNMNSINLIDNLEGYYAILYEIFLLIFQLIIVIILFVIVPIVWYRLVNNCSMKELLRRINIKRDQLDMVFVWGIITALISLGMVLIIGSILSFSGIADENASNIQDLELFFSFPSIIILITFQPIAEEFFFRGFLIDKIQQHIGIYPAIILTSILFGIAHVSMGNFIPAIIISLVALVFGYMVIKTKNLMTAIIGHILFNVISFLLYFIGKEILIEGFLFFVK